MLSLGAKLEQADLGCELAWLTLGASAAKTPTRWRQLRRGIALQQIEDPKLEGVPADACVEALAQYCAAGVPKVVLFNQSADTCA